MKKESVNKFDLEAAFKALDELDIPVVKGIKAHREDLKEKFTRKLTSEVLVEDYYDLGDSGELEQAQEDREAEIAKAKLARIEKIVDLEAESEEDLLPSYVGKVIIQCPQCMTLFYKNQEDIEKSEENPDVVNINETCQHCGNNSGYTLIGKVDQVGEDEAENYDVEDFEEEELNLDFPEGTEESDPEGTGEGAEEEETNSLDLDLDLEVTEGEEEPTEEEEEVKESLREAVEEDEIEEIEDEEVVEDEDSIDIVDENEVLYTPEGVKGLAIEAGEEIAEETKENPEISSEEIEEIVNKIVDADVEDLKADMEDEEEEVIEDEEEEVVEEALKEDVSEEPTNSEIVGFIDCSGSNGTSSRINDQIKIVTEAGATKLYFFSDNIYTNPVDACKFPRTAYGPIRKWVDENENCKAIVSTDEDVNFNDGREISNHERIEIIRFDLKKEALTEAVDKELDDKLKAHNEYIEYLKAEIEKAEKSLNSAKNDFVKKSIQSKLDALKADLEEALPEALKAEVTASDELPTPEESGLEDAAENKEETEETKESLKESLNEEVKIIGDLSDYSPWSGAVDTWNKIKDAGLVDDLDMYLEDCYPDGLTMTELNDILWFEGEEILNMLGIGEEEIDEALQEKGDLSEEEINDILNDETKTTEEKAEAIHEDAETETKLDEVEAELENSNVEDILVESPVVDALNELEAELSEGKLPREPQVFDRDGNLIKAKDSEVLKIWSKVIDYAEANNIDFWNDYKVQKQMIDAVCTEDEKKKLSTVEFEDGVVRSAYESLKEAKKDVSDEEFRAMLRNPVFNESCKEEELNEELPAVPNAPFEKAIDRIENAGEELTAEEEKIEVEETSQDINLDEVEDFDEKAFDSKITEYLNEVYNNVVGYVSTNCKIKDNNLVVEGLIRFNNNNVKNTQFILETQNNKLVGTNEDLAKGKAFTLNCKLDQKVLVAESLEYKYSVRNNLVEGLIK